MSLAPSIQSACEAIVQQGADMKAVLHSLRQMALPEAARMEVINGYSIMCGLIAATNALKTTVAAARMTGELPPVDVPTTALELHPVHYEPSRSADELELLRQSLHRAGDHTLDPEPGSEFNGMREGRAA